MGIKRFILVLFIIILTNSPISAETVVWDILDDGLWSESSNWNPAKIPDSLDDVVISNAGTGTITVDTDAAIKTLTLSGGHKVILSTNKLTIVDYLKVFVTSVEGKGNLGSWADAGGQTGLAAGDAICQARASAAGLSGTYKAWLSDSTTDAYCHIHGLTGKKAVNCGQVSLPTAAGPWVRTDGHPFAGTINELINNGQVYTPARYDENGAILSAKNYFTGTDPNGAASAGHCSNWTNDTNSYSARFGYTEGTTGFWTSYGGIGCDGSIRLLCFQTGTGRPLPSITAPAGSKKVFVTSVSGTGNLTSWADYSGSATGAEAGDTICQNRATAVGLTGTYKAWLSTSTPDFEAIDRITSTGPWYRLDGVKVADNKAALISTSSTPLFTAVSQTETGAYITYPSQFVWTATGDNGVGFAENCSNWSDASSGTDGRVGFATLAISAWTHVTVNSCNALCPLYCFED